MLPDLVYIVRPGDNPELRYSLRSIAANAAHLINRVWIVGTVPEWASSEVGKIPLKPQPEKFANQRQSLEAACLCRDITPEFVLGNDDFFARAKVDAWTAYHGGPIDGFIARQHAAGVGNGNTWLQAVKLTAEWMRQTLGTTDVDAYERHTPLLVDKARLAWILGRYPTDRRLAPAVTYPFTAADGVEHKPGPNVKVKEHDTLAAKLGEIGDVPWISTNDVTFADYEVGEYIRGRFPEPSRFER